VNTGHAPCIGHTLNAEQDRAQGERTVHDNVSRTAKPAHTARTVLTANPNRTKAPTRQEVNR
jgi:hypothetical protein